MEALEKAVRSIEQQGLVWGKSKLVAVGYGIKKLQINIVIEDELVSVDELQDKIASFDDYVQSSDVAAMQSEFHSLLAALTRVLTRRNFLRTISIRDGRVVSYRELWSLLLLYQ
jgi:translation elongation factor EF-1beta